VPPTSSSPSRVGPSAGRRPPPLPYPPRRASASFPPRRVRSGTGAAPSGLRRYGLNFFTYNLLQAPLAALLEYSGVVPSGTAPQALHHPSVAPSLLSSASEVDGLLFATAAWDGGVSIRIQGGRPRGPRPSAGPIAGLLPCSLPGAHAGLPQEIRGTFVFLPSCT
jgi:hypothetical protein